LRSDAEEGVAIPADWPENETFGDRVLLSPPATEADAADRSAEARAAADAEYHDWWFVTRER
jgi:peroxiredoxin (alkyl hydroperoxide reductase subunit C)